MRRTRATPERIRVRITDDPPHAGSDLSVSGSSVGSVADAPVLSPAADRERARPRRVSDDLARQRSGAALSRLAALRSRVSRLEFLADGVLLACWSLLLWNQAPSYLTPTVSVLSALLLAATTLAVYGASSMYATTQRPNPAALDELKRSIAATAVGIVLWFLLSATLLGQVVDRRLANLLLVWAALATLSSIAVQRIGRSAIRHAHPDRVLILGAGQIGQAMARRIASNRGREGVVIGFVDDHPLPLDESLGDIPVFDAMRPLAETIERSGATRLLIAFSGVPADDVLDTLRGSRVGWIPVGIVPRYFELIPRHAKIQDIDGIPIVDLHGANLSRAAQVTKRTLDVVGGGLGLLILSPLLAVIAVAIKVDSDGPVLFGQRRTGRGGEPFRMWKFRTMVVDAELIRPQLEHRNDMKDPGPLFKMRNDPRVTRVGRILRRYSLDELPQLLNVLRGTMSLVGPRPLVVREAEQMQGWSRRRLDIRPGITGLWQVRGRNDVPYDEMIRLDYLYVSTWSVWWDFRIILQTVPLVLGGRGAS